MYRMDPITTDTKQQQSCRRACQGGAKIEGNMYRMDPITILAVPHLFVRGMINADNARNLFVRLTSRRACEKEAQSGNPV